MKLLFALLTLLSCSIKPIQRNSGAQQSTSDKTEGLTVSEQVIQSDGSLTIVGNDSSSEIQKIPEHSEEIIAEATDLTENEENVSLPISADSKFLADYPINQKVKNWIEYFTVKDRERFQRFINNGHSYKKDIEKIFNKEKVPKELFYVGLIESGYYLKAKSHASAVGPWQFIRSAAKDYGLNVNHLIDERRDLFKSTEAAAFYFRDLYNIFGSWELALSAYNAGPSRIIYMIRTYNTRNFVELSTKQKFPKETANYVPKVKAVIHIIKNHDKYGFKLPNLASPYEYTKTLELQNSLPIRTIASKLNISSKTIYYLNPELKGSYTPMYRSEKYSLRIPAANYDRNSANYLESLKAKVPKTASAPSYSYHRVKKGENLSLIARKYGIGLGRIKQLNSLRGDKLLAGQKLRIKGGAPTKTSQKRSSGQRRSEIHRVRRGENLSVIAKKYGTTFQRLKNRNGLTRNIVRVGQRLKVPAREYYKVRRGDNLSIIAKRNNSDARTLMKINGLRSSKVMPGQKIYLK